MITTNFRVLFGNLEFPFSGGINDTWSVAEAESLKNIPYTGIICRIMRIVP